MPDRHPYPGSDEVDDRLDRRVVGAELEPLDLVFFDLELRRISLRRAVPPGRVAFERRARAVLELPADEPAAPTFDPMTRGPEITEIR